MNDTSANSTPKAPVNSATRGAVTGLAALGAVFSLPATVDAAVVYSGIQNISATLQAGSRHASNGSTGTASAFATLNLDGIGADDFKLEARQFAFSFAPIRGGLGRILPLGNNIVEGGEGGAIIRKTSAYVPGQYSRNKGLLRSVVKHQYGTVGSGYFANGVPGFVGVHFDQGGQTHYGWIRLQVDDGTQGFPYQVTAIDWAYESEPGTRIHVELDVPEANPGMVLLAAGGTGLAAWRLRRRQSARAATAN